MSHLAAVLALLTYLEWDLSQLTSYVYTSPEIVPVGSLYTHWRKGDAFDGAVHLATEDICGRVR